MTKKQKLFFLLLGAILLVSGIVLPKMLVDELHSIKVSEAQEKLLDKIEKAESLLLEMKSIGKQSEDELQLFSQRLQEHYQKEGLSFYAFHNQTLIYWSDDAVAFSIDSVFHGNKLQKFGNGWYLIKKQQLDDYSFISFIKIYRCFDHENKFLESGFPEDYSLDQNYTFSKTPSLYKIHDANGDFLFSLEVKKWDEIPAPFSYFYNVLYFLSILFILFGLSFLKSPLYYFLSIFLLLVLRLAMLFFSFPESLLQLELFGPKWYEGTFWIPSFGDLLLHSILLLFISYYLQQWIKSLGKRLVFLYLSPIILFSFAGITLYFMVSLLQNSEFALDLNNLLQLNFYSYLGLLLLAILFFSFFILADACIRKLIPILGKIRTFWILLASFVIGIGLQLLIETYYALYYAAFLLPIALIFVKGIRRKFYTLPLSLVLLLCFSAMAAFIIHKEGRKKEMNIRKDAIAEFAEEEDPIAEFLFAELQKKLVKDTVAHKLLSEYWANENAAVEYLENKYFNTYWEKFEVFFTPCFMGDSLMLASNNIEVDCISFFRQRMQKEGKIVSANNLFQLENKTGKISYLAEVPIMYKGKRMHLYIEIYTRAFNNNNGYPELLLDIREINKTIDLDEYSFAIYNNKQLVNSAGKFNYSLHWNTKLPEINEAERLEYSGYEHLLFLNHDNTMFVLSKKDEGFFNYLTSLSYLLTFFSLMLVPFTFLIPDFPIRIKLPGSDFTGRLQLFIIGSLLTTLVLFVISTSYFIQEQYHEKNVNAIGDKMRSVLIEIEQELSSEQVLDQDFKDYITLALIKLSNVFYTDINLYSPDGTLYASSRPEIFESGLKARRMHPQAVHHMILDHKTEFIQEESIGKMEYLSAYKTFRNNENELVAYLNLPYFAKQNQLENEISAFLVSTVNLYVIIFALAILISVFVVNQLSKPLQLIRSKIRKLRLGASNELIQWKSNDEIGSLVKEYNRMVVELGENVEQLAKSERESAWREMAKQVAHEIKNPLTPMKLSIQHLKRAYDDDTDDLDTRVERTTQTLIEQIDTLAGIANEFSNFANMPEVKKEQVDLVKSIETAANLYREEDKLEIEILKGKEPAIVLANKDHLLRVFNNLMKNAVQAIPENKKGAIEISILDEQDYWKVLIKDNGGGIAAEQKNKIFMPNFTTKTGGMGLGLAMVKTIMDSLNGKISFESEEGKGTVFYLFFPKGR